MSKVINSSGFSYDDVLIIPRYSDITSRSEIDVSTDLDGIHLDIPIIAANMDSITGVKMAIAMDRLGGLGILHRFMTTEQIDDSIRELCRNGVKYPAFSVGLDFSIEEIGHLSTMGAKIVCIDVAHGDHARVLQKIRDIKAVAPNIKIIAGNIATGDSAYNLLRAGASIQKVGIGPGSLCTTRIQTGCGYPQLSAIMSSYRRDTFIIADGGIRYPGDIAKAIGAGAKAVMIGNLFAGTDEAERPQEYRGMASRAAQEEHGKAGIYIEGEAMKNVQPKGPVKAIVDKLIAGLRSGMSYTGSRTISEHYENTDFVRITLAGLTESLPHGLYRQQ